MSPQLLGTAVDSAIPAIAGVASLIIGWRRLASAKRKAEKPVRSAQVLVALGPLLVVYAAASFFLNAYPPPSLWPWQAFVSKEYQFEARFPGAPKEVAMPQQTPLGELVLHRFSVERDAGQRSFSVSCRRYSKEQLEGGIMPTVEQLAELLQSQHGIAPSVTVRTREGKDFVADLQLPLKDFDIRMRVFSMGERQYIAQVVSPAGKGQAPENDQFLDSVMVIR